MSVSLQAITEEELRSARIVTAGEIGFIHDTCGEKIEDPDNTLLATFIVNLGQYVKFVIAQNETDRQASIGIFYSMQSAATAALALLGNLTSGADRSQVLSVASDEISYGGASLPVTVKGITLIGSGEIHKDSQRDVPMSMTTQRVFGLQNLSRRQMEIVRKLVFQKLGIQME